MPPFEPPNTLHKSVPPTSPVTTHDFAIYLDSSQQKLYYIRFLYFYNSTHNYKFSKTLLYCLYIYLASYWQWWVTKFSRNWYINTYIEMAKEVDRQNQQLPSRLIHLSLVLCRNAKTMGKSISHSYLHFFFLVIFIFSLKINSK